MAPTLNPTNNNGPSIPLSNAAQWYLLGNSSSGNVTLPGRLFPDSTTVAVGGAIIPPTPALDRLVRRYGLV